jgi:hypothetical protein
MRASGLAIDRRLVFLDQLFHPHRIAFAMAMAAHRRRMFFSAE